MSHNKIYMRKSLYNRCHDSELETLFEKLEEKNGRNRAKTKMRQVCAEDNNSESESVTIFKAIFWTFCFVLCLTWKLCHLDSSKNWNGNCLSALVPLMCCGPNVDVPCKKKKWAKVSLSNGNIFIFQSQSSELFIKVSRREQL